MTIESETFIEKEPSVSEMGLPSLAQEIRSVLTEILPQDLIEFVLELKGPIYFRVFQHKRGETIPSPDGCYLYSGSNQRVFDLYSGNAVCCPRSNQEICWSPDSSQIASRGSGEVSIFPVKKGGKFSQFFISENIADWEWGPLGLFVLFDGGDGYSLQRWDLETKEQVLKIGKCSLHGICLTVRSILLCYQERIVVIDYDRLLGSKKYAIDGDWVNVIETHGKGFLLCLEHAFPSVSQQLSLWERLTPSPSGKMMAGRAQNNTLTVFSLDQSPQTYVSIKYLSTPSSRSSLMWNTSETEIFFQEGDLILGWNFCHEEFRTVIELKSPIRSVVPLFPYWIFFTRRCYFLVEVEEEKALQFVGDPEIEETEENARQAERLAELFAQSFLEVMRENDDEEATEEEGEDASVQSEEEVSE